MQRHTERSQRLVIAGVAVALLATFAAGRAQIQQPGSPSLGNAQTSPLGNDRNNDRNADSNIDPAYAARQKRQQELYAMNDRHRHMAEDADKLLQMATELKAEVDKSTKNETSISAYNKADAIEKLAHDVKQRLKN